MMAKGEKNKLAILASLILVAAAGYAVSLYTAYEANMRTRISALEKAIGKLRVGEGVSPSGTSDGIGIETREGSGSIFDLSASMRSSLTGNGFKVTMEKTETGGVTLQARSENAGPITGFLKDLLGGRIRYGIRNMSLSIDSKGFGTMEIMADGKK